MVVLKRVAFFTLIPKSGRWYLLHVPHPTPAWKKKKKKEANSTTNLRCLVPVLRNAFFNELIAHSRPITAFTDIDTNYHFTHRPRHVALCLLTHAYAYRIHLFSLSLFFFSSRGNEASIQSDRIGARIAKEKERKKRKEKEEELGKMR